MPVTARNPTSNSKETFNQLDRDDSSIGKALLFENSHILALNKTELDKYITTLENAFKPNKKTFSKTKVIESKYILIEKFCTEVLNPLETVEKLKSFDQAGNWQKICQSVTKTFYYCDAVLDMLARNNSLPLLDASPSPGGKKKRFSINLIYALILDEISDINDVEIFREAIDAMFDSIVYSVDAIWDCDQRKMRMPDSDTIPTMRSNMENTSNAREDAYDQLESMEYNKIISREKHYRLLLLIRLVNLASGLLAKYTGLNIFILAARVEYLEEWCSEYIGEIMSITCALFHSAIQPERLHVFIQATEQFYPGVIKNQNNLVKNDGVVGANINQNYQPLKEKRSDVFMIVCGFFGAAVVILVVYLIYRRMATQ